MDNQDTGQDIEAQLKALQQQRLETCQAEIEAVLQKHKCTLTGVPTFKQANGSAWVVSVEVGVTLAK